MNCAIFHQVVVERTDFSSSALVSGRQLTPLSGSDWSVLEAQVTPGKATREHW